MPRFLHRWYAYLMGYFWLPCPLCEEYMGGHEWTNHDGIRGAAAGMTQGICNACAKKRALPCGCPPGKIAFGMEMHYSGCTKMRDGIWQQ